jgi:uncharacterized protein (DUF736 family)
MARPRNLEWTDQGPRDGLSLDRLPATASVGFFPLPLSGGIPRGTKKPSAAVLRDALGLSAAGRSLPGPRTAIEAAMGAARQQRGRPPWRPSVLSPRRTTAPTEKDNDKAPDYRIIAGNIECGAAWKKTARDSDREYLSVKLDDPSFPAPIYASLVKGEGDDSFNLIWSRRTAD